MKHLQWVALIAGMAMAQACAEAPTRVQARSPGLGLIGEGANVTSLTLVDRSIAYERWRLALGGNEGKTHAQRVTDIQGLSHARAALLGGSGTGVRLASVQSTTTPTWCRGQPR